MATLVTTAFTGTDGAAWPAPWTAFGGTAVIASNRGQLTSPTTAWSGGEAEAGLNLATGRVDVTVRMPAVPDRSARINVRWNRATGNGYRLIMPTDYNGFQLVKVVAYTESPLAEQFISPWAVSTDYRVAIEFTGKIIRAKRWVVGQSEPAAWDLVAADTTYTTGDVGLVVVNNASGGAKSVLFDDVTIVDTAVGLDVSRLGYHNDAFQGSFADLGTFTTFTPLSESATRQFQIDDTAANALLSGGESAEVNAPDTLGPAVKAELAALQFSFLNPLYHASVIASWTTEERAEIERRLGHRLRLTAATLPSTAAAGATVAVSLTFTNDGYARPTNNRPVQLVFVNGGTVVTRTLSLDVRTIAPSTPVTVNQDVTAPSAGTWSMHVALPDPAAGLAGNPAYAIQLANPGVWNATTGRNALGHNIVVS